MSTYNIFFWYCHSWVWLEGLEPHKRLSSGESEAPVQPTNWPLLHLHQFSAPRRSQCSLASLHSFSLFPTSSLPLLFLVVEALTNATRVPLSAATLSKAYVFQCTLRSWFDMDQASDPSMSTLAGILGIILPSLTGQLGSK